MSIGMKPGLHLKTLRVRGPVGFTLVEVLISIVIAGAAVAGIVGGYHVVVQRAEWASASTAAHLHAVRRLELVRSARWDPACSSYPTNANDLVATNFPPLVWPLDVPQSGTTVLVATNWVRIEDVPGSTVPLRIIEVECVWSLPDRGPFTNTVVSYRAPDQ
jgi:type II secretory pathway pseudopilin PulG